MTTLSSLFPKHGSRKAKRRIGLGIGSGMGRSSTKGMKGQTSRSGNTRKESKEGGQMPLTRRLPKRGFYNYFKKQYAIINVSDLEKFENGATVNIDILFDAKIIGRKEADGLKVLGNGTLTKKLNVEAAKFTATAKEKIEKAGGKIEVK